MRCILVSFSLRRAVLTVFLSLFTVAPTWAWWETGHRVVARIAAAQLTPAARTRIARILDVADTPDAVADALAVASTWADETKGQTHTQDWHYVDLTLEDHKDAASRRCPQDNCAPARIHLFAAALRSHDSTRTVTDIDSLRYLVHLVGDIHQPLHAATDADQGGNCEALLPPVLHAKNLHALWDGGIVDAMNFNPYTLTTSLQDEILKFSEHERDKLAGGSVLDWTWDSHEVALANIYAKLHIPREPSIFPHSCDEAPEAITSFHPVADGLYVDSMKPVVRLQLIKAGLRLARLLNESM